MHDMMADPYGLTASKQPDADFLSEKLNKVQQMYDTLKKEYDEQKKFYDEALEARTNQLEEAETESEKLKSELELSKKLEVEVRSKNESLQFDNEMLNKRIETTSQDKTNASQREEGLLKQLDELNIALKQKESIIEQKVDENFGIKQRIDSMRNENEKQKKRIETLDDVLRSKDQEIHDYDRELETAKGEIQQLNNKEQTLLRDLENLKNENNHVKNQLRGEQEKYAQIYNEFNNLKEALHISKQREQSAKAAADGYFNDLENMTNQLNQANNYIKNQDSQITSLKSQLEQAKTEAFNAQQRLSYAPPPQYQAPVQYESYPQQYTAPAQYQYAQQRPQKPSYQAQPEYSGQPQYAVSKSTPTKPRSKWESEPSHYEPSYDDAPGYDSPPAKEAYSHGGNSRNSYREPPAAKIQSQSLEYNASQQYSGMEHNYSTKHLQHAQSTMGSLLTWEEEETKGSRISTQQTPPRRSEEQYMPGPARAPQVEPPKAKVRDFTFDYMYI